MINFEGSVAVVTGAAGGIGQAISKALANRGVKVAMVDFHEGRLDEAIRTVKSQTNGTILGVQADVRLWEELERARDEVLQAFGQIHYFFNNAGIGGGGPIMSPTASIWKQTIDINLMGVAYGLQIFGPCIQESDQDGYVVNTASMAGVVHPAGLGAYNASKHGVVAITKALKEDLDASGSKMGVSVLCPGLVNTQITVNSVETLNMESNSQADDDENSIANTLQFGMQPDTLAERVIEAMHHRDLYIFTDGSFRSRYQSDVNEVLAGFDAVDNSEVLKNAKPEDVGMRVGDVGNSLGNN